MSITHLSSIELKRLVALIRKKDKLRARIAKIDGQLSAIDSAGVAKAASRMSKRGGARKGPGHGRMRDAILEVLTKAGKEGASIAEVAEGTGAKAASIAVWFYTAGKKLKGLRKVGRGVFAYSAK